MLIPTVVLLDHPTRLALDIRRGRVPVSTYLRGLVQADVATVVLSVDPTTENAVAAPPRASNGHPQGQEPPR